VDALHGIGRHYLTLAPRCFLDVSEIKSIVVERGQRRAMRQTLFVGPR